MSNVDGELGVGLDLATHITGVFEARGEKLLGARLLKVPVSKPANERDWEVMAATVIALLDAMHPDYVAIEDVYYKKNAETFKRLSLLAGGVRTWLVMHNIPCYVAKTSQIDSACNLETGNKKDSRKPSIVTFATRLGFNLPQDAADALAVLYWGMSARRMDLIAKGQWNVD